VIGADDPERGLSHYQRRISSQIARLASSCNEFLSRIWTGFILRHRPLSSPRPIRLVRASIRPCGSRSTVRSSCTGHFALGSSSSYRVPAYRGSEGAKRWAREGLNVIRRPGLIHPGQGIIVFSCRPGHHPLPLYPGTGSRSSCSTAGQVFPPSYSASPDAKPTMYFGMRKPHSACHGGIGVRQDRR